MKAILYAAIVLALAVLTCGCATTPAIQPAANGTTPNLTGNWTGPAVGYLAGTGFTNFQGGQMTMSITAQKDRIFEGKFIYPDPVTGVPKSIGIAGAIARDGKTLTLTQESGGYSSGMLISPGEIELIYANDAEPMEVAIDTLKRS
jgi:hypothetical protein